MNDNLESREFQTASNAAYSFFLHDLCDVYIEATKPLFETNIDSPEKVSAQNTLHTALEAGLKLLHPFMPYVTEDLWQRLPRRPRDECESIMLASFPEKVCYSHITHLLMMQVSQQDFPEAEADFDLVIEVIKAARSVVGMYNLPTNGKTIEDKITGMSYRRSRQTPLIPQSSFRQRSRRSARPLNRKKRSSLLSPKAAALFSSSRMTPRSREAAVRRSLRPT